MFLVLGSNSFTGSSFISQLLANGDDVIGVSRSEEAHEAFLPHRWSSASERKRYSFNRYDLNLNIMGIARLMEEYRPSYVVNFAAQGMVAESWDSPEDWYATNLVAPSKLFNKIKEYDFVKKYVHVTTPEVYGHTDGWIKESNRFSPSTPYATSRAACDMHLLALFKAYEFPVVFTRSANVYGPGQQLYRIIPRTIHSAICGSTLELHGGGQSERAFVHARDVADATLRITKRGTPGESYHISSRSSITIRELVESIYKTVGSSFERHVKVVEERVGKDQSYLLSSEKLRRELNWVDEVDLVQGINETLSWFRKYRGYLTDHSLYYTHKK